MNIVAMGGGGFSMEPENLRLDRYVLGLASVERPRVLFVPTASGDAKEYVDNFYKAFRTLPAEPAHLSLFQPPAGDLRRFVLGHQVVYVGGGNTRNLLLLWREWGLDAVLREAWEKGVVLAGVSAGALCWFEEGVTDSFPGRLSALPCLGWLAGSYCPHYDGEAERRPAYRRLLDGGMKPGIACDDGAAVHFRGRDLHKVVLSRPHARAYRVEPGGRETELPGELL